VKTGKHWFIKRWLLQGIIITLPIIATIVVFYYTIIYADAALWFLWDLFPWDLLPWTINKPSFPGLGLLVVATALILLGALTESWLVSRVMKSFNGIIERLPVVRNIYTTVLKVAQSTLGGYDNFSKVILIEYPRKGIYTLGFKTSECSSDLNEKLGAKNLINVFVPTTPNPTSGFYLILPEDQVIDTDLKAEEAFKLIVSAGIVQK